METVVEIIAELLAAMNVTVDARKYAMLLHYSEGEVFHIFETLYSTSRIITPATANAAEVAETDYEASFRALQEYFNPRKNVDFEILVFCQAKQYQE